MQGVNNYLPKAYEIMAIKKETAIDWTFTVAFDAPVIGGQFLQISIPGVGEAPISISDFDENTVALTIRKVGRLTDQIFNLSVGDSLFMRGPYGNGFPINAFMEDDLVIIAGGTGLAPVKNTLKELLTLRKGKKNTHVILGFKSPSDVLFMEEIEEWMTQATVILTVDKADNGWVHKEGLVTEYIKFLPEKNRQSTKAIVVGPPLMMKFTTLELLKNGISEENITVSFERKMSCGIGKCGHCKIDETYVCVEGPVFNYTKAKELID